MPAESTCSQSIKTIHLCGDKRNIAGASRSRIERCNFSISEIAAGLIEQLEQLHIPCGWSHPRIAIRKFDLCRSFWQVELHNLAHSFASFFELFDRNGSQIAVNRYGSCYNIRFSKSRAATVFVIRRDFGSAIDKRRIKRQILFAAQLIVE